MEILHGTERVLTREEAAHLISSVALEELKAIRAAIEALPKAIAAAVREELIEASEPVTGTPAPTGCQHPDDKRADLGGDEWECTVRWCGYRHVPEPAGAPV